MKMQLTTTAFFFPAKGVCSELKKFQEHEKRHTKQSKLKYKQGQNSNKSVSYAGKDQEIDEVI